MFLQPLRFRRAACRVGFAPALVLIGAGIALGGEPKGSGFRDSIRQIANERSRIKSYDVTITAAVKSTEESVVLTDGSVVEVEKRPVGFTLELAFEAEPGRLLVARRNRYLLKSTGKEIASGWLVYASTPEWQLFRYDGEPGFVTDPGGHRGSKPDYLDPRALGLAFPLEFRRGDPLDVIVGNYLKWPDDFRKQRLADGKIRYERRNGSYSLVIDTQHGHWPIAMTRLERGKVAFRYDLSIAKVHGQWLPEAVTEVRPKERTDLKLEWHLVNQPLPKDRFTVKGIGERYGFSTVDRHAKRKGRD